MEFRMLLLQDLARTESSSANPSHAPKTSSSRSTPSPGRSLSSGQPSGLHIHSTLATSLRRGGSIPQATLWANCSSVFARAVWEIPTAVPSTNSMRNHPASVNSPSETVLSSSPLLHLTSSPLSSMDELSRLQSTHSVGGEGVLPVKTKPPSQEKNHWPALACSSQTSRRIFGWVWFWIPAR